MIKKKKVNFGYIKCNLNRKWTRREIQSRYWKRCNKKYDDEINKKIGDKCLICNSKKKLHCHEKNFKKHKYLNQLRRKRLYLKYPENFIRLCHKHHHILHLLHKCSKEEIKFLMELLK